MSIPQLGNDVKRTPLRRNPDKPLERGAGLGASPAKTRNWVEKHRGKGFRKHPRIPDAVRDAVFARSDYKCIRCKRQLPLDPHHVLPKDDFPHLVLIAENMVGICRNCHEEHELAARRIRRNELPKCALALALHEGPRALAYLERVYPTNE